MDNDVLEDGRDLRLPFRSGYVLDLTSMRVPGRVESGERRSRRLLETQQLAVFFQWP
jgi:hypothetical protein